MRLQLPSSVFLSNFLRMALCLAGLCSAGSGLRAQSSKETVTLGANPSSLMPGQTATLTALVQNATNTNVVWSFSPAVPGAVPGPMTTVSDPATGISTNTYTAPQVISANQTVKVTVTTVSGSSLTASATITLTSPLDVGTGAPTPSLQNAFVSAFFRNNFFNQVTLPPVGIVRRLGSLLPAGYVQEFNDKNGTGKLALATISPSAPQSADATVSVVQLQANLYAYYTSVGANTAGYPMADTQFCPVFDPANSCKYDTFDKGYALFAYDAPLPNGQNFTVRQLFYTEWNKQGGISGLGRPIDAESPTVTSGVILPPATAGNTAIFQSFSNGDIYTITSGPNKGTGVFSVLQPILGLYNASGGPTGNLGLPIGQQFSLANGDVQQKFEGAALQYTPGGGGPTVRLPVTSVTLSGVASGTIITPGTPVTLKLGDTLSLTASPIASSGAPLTDRLVSWTTTNNRVLQIQPNSLTAMVKAVGGGSASLTAASEGVTSPKLIVNVIAPCCQIGDGAPPATQQAFQTALTRNKISVQTPVASPALRVGNGYTQVVQSSDATPVTYLLAQSDRLGTAYVLGGAVLNAYQILGGASGTLGYPISDQTPGVTQLFENSAALGGSPVRLVTGAILAKWALLGYEKGTAGPPASDAASFSTFGANSGVMQSFGTAATGAIFAATAGPRSGQAYYVSGLILARYIALGGAGGPFGMATSDEFVTGSLHQQNFEGGNLTYTAGDAAAVEHATPKSPGVVVSPAALPAGGRARLAVVGFPNNSTIRVSLSGLPVGAQPDFVVTTATGAYSWEMFFPLTSKSGMVMVHAADTKGPAAADGTLTVRGFADNRVPLTKIQGDNQTGAPGALAPLALRVALRDASGDPVVGAAVVFQGSAGTQLTAPKVLTDANGMAETFVRLPASEGLALVDAQAPAVAQSGVTFGLRSAAATLSNFPKLVAAGDTPLGNGAASIGQKGALLTAAASILRYHQNRGELPAPNGTADAPTLNAFLKADCSLDAKGTQNCDGFLSGGAGAAGAAGAATGAAGVAGAAASGEQIVNLWRAAEFTGGVDISIESPVPAAIADLVAQGSPVLLSLGLSLNGSPMGGHFVVATGIAADGSLVIQDPSALFARTSLADYLHGFSVPAPGSGAAGGGATGGTPGAGTWKADLLGAVRFALRSPAPTRFLVTALSQPSSLINKLALDVSSAAGTCGRSILLPDSVDSSGNAPANSAAANSAAANSAADAPLVSRILACDGSQPVYQISVGAAGSDTSTNVQPFSVFVMDLAPTGSTTDLSGSAPAVYKATRPKLALTVAPQDITFAASSVVNGATFTPGIAPGGVMAIFGAGLAGAGRTTNIDMDGTAVRLLFTSPFQINAEVPLTLSPGPHTLHIQSAYGAAQQQVNVAAVAPQIFLVGNPPAGAIVNQDNTLNGPSNPLPRGKTLVIYATGLGAAVNSGPLFTTAAPVTVVLNGTELPAAFAGLSPGYIGLYQVNVTIPADMAPGLALSLTLKESGQTADSVAVAIQ